jgi:hypothetical protein
VREARDPAARAEADEDDDPALVGDHRAGRHLAGHIPGGVHRQPVHRPPALQGDLLGGRDELSSGVVDEHVDAAEAPEGRVHEDHDLLGLAHVGGHG